MSDTNRDVVLQSTMGKLCVVRVSLNQIIIREINGTHLCLVWAGGGHCVSGIEKIGGECMGESCVIVTFPAIT